MEQNVSTSFGAQSISQVLSRSNLFFLFLDRNLMPNSQKVIITKPQGKRKT